jgi:hypothetical protein
MAAYTWELGIDWNAIETSGSRYLRQAFVLNEAPGVASAMSSPNLTKGDTISFQIFDLTIPAQQVTKIGSFVILAKSAVGNQTSDCPVDPLQLTFTRQTAGPDGPQKSKAFGSRFPSWISSGDTTVINNPGRFLLTFQVQAFGPAGSDLRVFGHDPEMVVGPNT